MKLSFDRHGYLLPYGIKEIDIVTFIDAAIFRQHEQKLDNFWSFSLEAKGLGAYIVEVYSEKDKHFVDITQKYLTIWENRFGRDKSGLQKGFLEINL